MKQVAAGMYKSIRRLIIQGSTDTAIDPDDRAVHACRNLSGSKVDLLQTTTFINAIKLARRVTIFMNFNNNNNNVFHDL